jgi:hypothetical protein
VSEPRPPPGASSTELFELIVESSSELMRREVPFVFVTGYDKVLIPEAYAAAPRCEKPLDLRRLLRVLTEVGVAADQRGA